MIDILNPTESVIASGLEGKIIMIYGNNNLGKTAQAVRFPKPYVIACENGLNGLSGVKHHKATCWSDVTTIVNQFTNPFTLDKVKEMYSTVIIDEVYASSLYCQDYVTNTYGGGALTLADGDSKHNLYQIYEKTYFKMVNQLVNSGFTVVFIAHQQADTKTGFITPKGDKRCIAPIVDKCDYVVYLRGNGVDGDNRVIKSSAFLAQTNEFFARSRIEYTPTYIKEFTAENLTAAIQEGINKKAQLEGATVVSYQEQVANDGVEELDFDALVSEFNSLIMELMKKPEFDSVISSKITMITDQYLGAGGKVSTATPKQVEAIRLIIDEVKKI